MDKTLENQVNKYIEICRKGKFYTKNNSKTMIKFYKHCKARNISDARILSYFTRLKMTLKVIGPKDFESWDKEDIQKVFTHLSNKNSNNGREYSAWTRETVLNILKAFFRWIYDTEDTPKLLKGMKRSRPPNTLTKEDLLTPQEIEAMLRLTKNHMWKGLIATLTTGARPGEIYGIKLRDIYDESDFVKIYVGSTGKMSKKLGQRAVYIQKFANYLRDWLEQHPRSKDREAWLFVDHKGKRIKYNFMKYVVKTLANNAGIKKPKGVYPYIFRHTMATYYYAKYGTVYARRLLGHAAGSRMEAVYCHLSETDIEDVLRGDKSENNTLPDFGDMTKREQNKAMEKIFFKFFNENRDKFLEIFEQWNRNRK